jgi:hypothetical protein
MPVPLGGRNRVPEVLREWLACLPISWDLALTNLPFRENDRVAHDSAAASTHLLRTGDDPMWARLRSLLAEHGFDPQSIAWRPSFPTTPIWSSGSSSPQRAA